MAETKTAAQLFLPTASASGTLQWIEITDATTVLTSGRYIVGALTGPLSPAVTLSNGDAVRIWDPNDVTATHTISLLPAGNSVTFKDPATGTLTTVDGFTLDAPQNYNDLEFVQITANVFQLDLDPQTIGAGGGLVVAAVQQADFSVTAGNEYPCDLSTGGPTDDIVATIPAGLAIGSAFAVADITGLADVNRRIEIRPDVTERFNNLVFGDYAEINGANGRIHFLKVETDRWRIAANPNI